LEEVTRRTIAYAEEEEMNMIQVMADELANMRDERNRLRRENSILRSELKERLVSEWSVNYDMSEEATEQAAEQYIIQMVVHNEGAE
jgi:regulator of replication initiation timing